MIDPLKKQVVRMANDLDMLQRNYNKTTGALEVLNQRVLVRKKKLCHL